MPNPRIEVVSDGAKLQTTQTGKQRERFSRLYGVFMEEDETGEMSLVIRNFPSQRIMYDWMSSTGWAHPSRAGKFLIFSGEVKEELMVRRATEVAPIEKLMGLNQVEDAALPREPAAPKPPIKVSQADAAEVSDISTVTLDIDVGEDGGVHL